MSTTTIRDIREIVREEPLMHPAILEALKAGPLTIPEIERRLIPVHEAVPSVAL